MSYETLRYIFIGAAIAGIVMFIVSVILFFVLRIPKVISDLSGATARRAIREIREQNEKTGAKQYKASAFNVERGKLTDKISASGRLFNRGAIDAGFGYDTAKIATQNFETAELSNDTTVLEEVANETIVLNEVASETTVLSSEGIDETASLDNFVSFSIECEITYVHSDEIIELEDVI